MKQTTKPRVKICCISSIEEAKMAIIYGASALGLVSAMPSGIGVISEELIAEISAIVPPGVCTFLFTSKQDVKSIIEQQRRCQVNTIQICDYLTLGKYQDLRDAMPGIALVQVIHVTGEESVKEAVEVSPLVDAILLDSGNKYLPIKQLGGTGKVHNWDISKKIRELVDVPVYLAGGLNSENVTAAIKQVSPFGLDICTGVRTNNKLDEMKLSQFFSQIYYSSFGVDEVQNFRE
ncbi:MULTISPECIES: phosphoribosylanthranilate isomerase [Okeania]|uniref:N-(5'-phosphoribosyl)anthranilate isomerase n=1 Tax=Okeania hirsuta TaxID=1458930 RepID=A0A3N6RCR6_9CYAN|nr:MULTISPECIES: phosphoribosylanthranilate isomerase [Okeania]NES79575.1 phosphoribosylanthranilate isomerase [Okeania sp. SIO1H4]NES92469.1 phosphoribosylanthranilate isomerase [Okeania sp. SIO2B9]NET23246.1 phosphoribosylanthranilate isomerase [Okeania sp. SIO1H5]NET79881.1 phosphoribosylanthranilate isomerase [Okeania sp. SIO1F9]NET96990.1 phosphoribosylanthranilate isomerase [Okeania sp. SIO1H2]